jgi:hypothetical protein
MLRAGGSNARAATHDVKNVAFANSQWALYF